MLSQAAGVRFEWGPAAAAIAGPLGAMVVVDVLSFTTSVTIVTGRGTEVLPHPWPAPDLATFAAAHDAVLAVSRDAVDGHHRHSLSPSHLSSAPVVDRLVLPSPNGSAIAASSVSATVVAGCLRNASSVARWLDDHGFGRLDRPLAVVAAGERWPDGTLRPALEDLLGAGAIVAALPDGLSRSPEAVAAEGAWLAHCRHLREALTGCSSGRELIADGYLVDVLLAGEHDVDATVPVLTGGVFVSASTGRGDVTPSQ